MILGFAHLTINVEDLGQAEFEWLKKGYSRNFLHNQVANHPSKRVFTHSYLPFHGLLLLKGRGLWPLELTCHGPTEGENRQLIWSKEAIVVRVREPATFQRVLIDGLGFELVENGSLHLDSRLPGWSCRIRLKKDQNEPVRLDAPGPTCLAFYSNRVEEDACRLTELGAFDYTGIFELTLGQRNLSIAMMRLPGGPLLELIAIRTNFP